MNCHSPLPAGWGRRSQLPPEEDDGDGRGVFLWLLIAAVVVLVAGVTIAVLWGRGWP